MKLKMNWFIAVIFFVLVLTGCQSNDNQKKNPAKAEGGKYENLTVKLGVQGKGGLFGKAREEKWFEDAFGKRGVKVEWIEFQSGPPMIEAMASKHLDFAGMGNMPPIAAQASGVDFKIISQLLEGKNNVAIIVPEDSKIKTVKDLKGKKVAVTKGSNAYNFLYRVLDQEGLKESDLDVIQLQPDETQPSFDGGKVEAWAVWDPYITLNTGKARVLADGASTGILSPSFQTVRGEFASQYPDLVTLYLETLEKARKWEESNRDEAYQRYAKEYRLPLEVVKGMQERGTFINIPVTDEIAKEQQKSADFQLSLGTIRKKVKVSDVIDNTFIEKALQQSK